MVKKFDFLKIRPSLTTSKNDLITLNINNKTTRIYHLYN